MKNKHILVNVSLEIHHLTSFSNQVLNPFGIIFDQSK
jgi:hypothetical protein